MVNPKIVRVIWLDACDKDVSDKVLKEMIESDNGNEYLVETESIGELIKITRHIIILRHNKSQPTEEGDDNELTIIPRDWATDIIYYKEQKK